MGWHSPSLHAGCQGSDQSVNDQGAHDQNLHDQGDAMFVVVVAVGSGGGIGDVAIMGCYC
eukprot:2201517-Lingulodinium_polyedra.AAC.1